MSYLARLKQHLAQNPSEPAQPFEGFEGDRDARVSPKLAVNDPFEGFEGGEGACVCGAEAPEGAYVPSKKKERSSKYLLVEQKKGGLDGHTRPPEAPSKPSKGVILRQTNMFRCFICGVHETAEKPLLPFLAESGGGHHWMHFACWPEHVLRCAEARAAASPTSFEGVAS